MASKNPAFMKKHTDSANPKNPKMAPPRSPTRNSSKGK